MNANREALVPPGNEYTDVHFESQALRGENVQIRQLTGRETISQPFEYEIFLVAFDRDAVDVDALLGSPASLRFQKGLLSENSRVVHGTVARIDDCFESAWGHPGYRLRFVPRVWRLALQETLDIFMDLSVPDIVRRVLTAAHFTEQTDFEFRLRHQYAARDFVVQYKETDLNFISRLTEHVGISYFFEHRDERDVIVFVDDNLGFSALDADSHVFYNRQMGTGGVHTLESRTQLVSSRVVIRDYNYRKPSLDVFAEQDVPSGLGGTIVEYGPHCKVPEEASDFARVRAEEIQAGRRVFLGESTEPKIGAGLVFTVEETPSGDVPLLVVEMRCSVIQPVFGEIQGGEKPYSNEFRAIPRETTYRPPRVTPKPRVHGTLTGIIEPSDSQQYAELDEEGRYRVRFMFDTAAPGERKASKPVRMAQPHAGPGYGMHFPLRPYTEVILVFADGDPDRPIIVGAAPNPQTPSPVVVDNAHKNIIRSGGANEIEIDDNEGEERIKLSTPNMSTVFQLGAPNAPESGAMLATVGASTTVATTGIGTISTIQTQITALTDLRKAKDITAMAEDAGPVDKAVLAATAALALIAATTAVVSLVRSGMNARIAGEKLDAAKSQADVDEKTDALVEPQENLTNQAEAVRNSASSPVTPQEQAVLDALAAYEAAVAKLDQDRTALETARDAKAEAHRKGMTDTEAAADETIATAEATVAADEAAREARRQELAAAIAALPADSPMKSAGESYLTQAEEVETKKDDLAQATATAKADSRDATDVEYEYTTGETGVGLAATESALGIASATSSLLSLIYNLYNLVKKKEQDLTLESQWKQGGTDLGTISPRCVASPTDNPFGVGAFPFSGTPQSKRVNYQGSAHNAALYGFEKAYVWGETAVLCGRSKAPAAAAATGTTPPPAPSGKAVVMGEKLALLLSNDVAEVKGVNKALVSGKEIDAESTELMKLTSVEKSIEVLAKELVKITSSDKVVEVLAKELVKLTSSDQGIELMAKDVVKLISSDANIECVAPKAELKGDAKTIALTATESLTLKCGGSSLTLKSDGTIELKGVNVTAEGSASAALKGVAAEVNGSGTCDVKSGGVATIAGSLVKIN